MKKVSTIIAVLSVAVLATGCTVAQRQAERLAQTVVQDDSASEPVTVTTAVVRSLDPRLAESAHQRDIIFIAVFNQQKGRG